MAVKNETIKPKLLGKRAFLTITTLGVVFLIIPLVLIVTDPMFIIGKYNFRLANGTVLHEIFSQELECGRFEVFLFNITNADRFQAGEDDKLHLEEVGPFTYIEYRTHKDLLLKDGIMSYTPKLRSEFVPEDSVANPEELNITMPNIPLLSATTLLSKSPLLIRSLFSMIAGQFGSKALVRKTAQEYLWGYHEPVLSLANRLAPGIVHFHTTGIMDRMYDKNEYYQLELGATDADKFSVKTVTQFRVISSGGQETVTRSTATYNDTYEGIAYPPKLPAEAPINILRVGICKSFPMTLCGKTTSQYGPDALVYEMSEKAYGNTTLCNSKGFCPKGLMDMSPCYMGLPLALSNGHFLGGDPRLFDRIHGLKPDKKKHSSHMVIEPFAGREEKQLGRSISMFLSESNMEVTWIMYLVVSNKRNVAVIVLQSSPGELPHIFQLFVREAVKIGLTLETKLSLQVSMVLGDLDYNTGTRRFSDIVLPVAHFQIRQPRLPEIAVRALKLMYITMPRVLLVLEVTLAAAGALLLGYSVTALCQSRTRTASVQTRSSKPDTPLITNDVIL